MINVKLPSNDDVLSHITATLKIINIMEDTFNQGEKIKLDLSQIDWILPCAALLISSKINELISKGGEVAYISPENIKVKKYLLDVGFPLGSKTEGYTYIPINHIQRDSQNNTGQMNKEANDLLNKIRSKIPINFGQSIIYIIGELADNIDQHSNFSFASVMAQYYPNKNYLDICFIDNGMTIPWVFEVNRISFNSDSDAINQALQGKVSTKKDEGLRAFGLKSCKKLVEETNGEIHIVSRKGILILSSKKAHAFFDIKENLLRGTLVYFRLNTPKSKIDIYPIIEPRND